MNPLTIIIIIAVAVVLWLIVAYNGLVRLKNRAEEAWSDIDVQLKRRYDLIPRLVETVKGYAKHESGVFERVTEARSRAINAESKGDVNDVQEAEGMLTGALKTLFAVAENYPDLKANANFLELQRELSDTENKIQASRRFYNTNVRDFNIKIERFPDSLIARPFGFKQMELFETANEAEREPVSVKF